MFYFGVFNIFFSIITMAVPLEILKRYGMSPVPMFFLFWSLILLVLGSVLINREISKPHKISKISNGLGVIFVFISLILCSGLDEHMYLADLLVAASFLIPGLLLYSYNKEPKKAIDHQTKKVESISEPKNELEFEVKRLSKIDLLILKLRALLFTNHAQNNESFKQHINTSILVLIELQNENFDISPFLVNEIMNLIEIYQELDSKIIQTERSEELISKLINSFELITKALVTSYDRSFEEKAFIIESNLKSLELKLKSEGLMPSDFEIKKVN